MSECYCGGVAACLPCQERDAADARPMTLTDFLLARIAEDERAARDRYIEVDRDHLDTVSDCDCGEDHISGRYLVAHPARVLVECEAKRRIVEEFTPFATATPQQVYTSRLLFSLLALPYADHPDYREEWKP